MVINSPSTFIGIQGDGYISFGSGQPDLPPPQEIFEVMKDYKEFKYGLIKGQLHLRKALAEQYPNSTPHNFVITNGASEAIDLVLRVIFLRGGKKVLLPKPYYYYYPHNVQLAGMEPVYTQLVNGKIDIEDFKKKIVDCSAVIINSPSNPTGRVQDIDTLKEIEKICEELKVIVISDEVYKDLIYTRENYLIQGPHVVTINSFSKTFSMCGFRIGYFWSLDQDLVNKVVEIKTHTSMNTNILAQEMAFAATKIPREKIMKQISIWEERRDLLVEGLEELGFDVWEPEGAFYLLPKPPEGVNPNKFVEEMFEKHKVITYKGEWFGAPNRIRFSYALDKEKIEEGLERIEKYLKE